MSHSTTHIDFKRLQVQGHYHSRSMDLIWTINNNATIAKPRIITVCVQFYITAAGTRQMTDPGW